jgi:hypothetical protein
VSTLLLLIHKVNTWTPLYATSTNTINRTRAATPPHLQTNGGKDESNIVFMWKSQRTAQDGTPLHEHMNLPPSLPVFFVGPVAHPFSFLGCPIMYLYFVNSVLRFPLRFHMI